MPALPVRADEADHPRVTLTIARRAAVQQQVLRPSGEPTGKPTLHALKLLQIWQWEGASLQNAIEICNRYGFTGLLVKALDGTSWMNQFDGSHDALRSVDQVAAQAQAAHASGLYYFAWTNPLQTNWKVQATLTAAIAIACDGALLDVEPYNQFWGPSAPIGLAREFMTQLRGAAPDAFIALQPDPRTNALQSIRLGEWLPFTDALSGQHYWSDFGSDPTAELQRAVSLGEGWGIPILPTLPGNAPTGGFPLDLIGALPGFVVWRMGSTPANTLSVLGSRSVAGLASSKLKAPFT